MLTTKRIGNQTVVFENPPLILSSYSLVGPKEGKGPLGNTFHKVLKDTYDGEKSWEKTESKMMESAMRECVNQANLSLDMIDYILAGDLLNQIISSNFAARQLGQPFIGLYGACSTMALSLGLGGMLIDGGFANNVLCGASSHHNTAERQYRMPTEQGNQRALYSQWTVTGAGSLLLGNTGNGPRITSTTLGRILDYGETDANNMGAAMAPAAADTIINHLSDLNRAPSYYDLIISGDLGSVGLKLTQDILKKSNIETPNFSDCGLLIFNKEQDTHAGGSGCGCSAVVLAGYLMEKIKSGEISKILLIGSGCLHSPTSAQQGESLPGIGHAVAIEK